MKAMFPKLEPGRWDVASRRSDRYISRSFESFCREVVRYIGDLTGVSSGAGAQSDSFPDMLPGDYTGHEDAVVTMINDDGDDNINGILSKSCRLDKAKSFQFELIENVDIKNLVKEKLSLDLKEILNSFHEFLFTINSELKQPFSNLQVQNIFHNVLYGALFNYLLINKDDRITLLHGVKSIISLIWFYYAIAVNRDQTFVEGTFTVVSKEEKDSDIDSLLAYLIRFGTARISSHFTALAKLLHQQRAHYGLDMPELPADKKTILFGKINQMKSNIFIKPENAGFDISKSLKSWTKLKELMKHSHEYILCRLRKRAAKMKDGRVKTYLVRNYGTDDEENYRKERVPNAVLKQYEKIIKKTASSKAVYNRQMKEAEAYGIQKMYEDVEQLESSKFVSQSEVIQFLKTINDTYDYINYRFGREVILTKDYLKTVVSGNDAQLIMNIKLNIE
ncbi:unnamed protein product [Didymodactylos carnosus]|uniref:Uncharacterized protein n=1 Tax=Didymodactylos carnosus TaxID=1234261 RepID=A0A814CL28_9BILA|nr:unnamed protein product [Didymodactylos carnosus]CAF1168826.1 unnamed protein product [Didymodactylos carnosus]CAF3718149.1 unnamed protein product [Didymodactylos carnosus]CAF3980224.1 unnamed protein product [Didymodactylos carnosus]